MEELLTLQSSLGERLNVVGFRGFEAVSTPYRFDIFVTLNTVEASDEDLAAVVGTRASLTLDRQDDRPPYTMHGVLSELEVIHELDGRLLVGITLVPQFWALLGGSRHSRIFTDRSLPDVIRHVLDEAGMTSDEFELRLVGKYDSEEHVCQYQESDFDFVSRWMEREGLYYFFEHGDAHEVLVITDNAGFSRPSGEKAVRFHPVTGTDVSSGEVLRTFRCRVRQLPARVRVDDYDYARPDLAVTGQTRVSKAGVGEVRLHGCRVFSPDQGARLASLRAQELVAGQRVYHASGTASHLRSGHTFKLQDHPRSDGEYFVTRIEHEAVGRVSTPELRRMTGLETEEVYRVEVTAIRGDVQFRTEQRTPWPRIYGVEHGVIDGEQDSEYAQLDDAGRYRVRFAFDELDEGRGRSSTWVRMMQPHGGATEGWHFPLRKDTEVLFTFLGGDPDRPVIAGVVPNAQKPSPVTRTNHTTNVIQTGGNNRFELEDKAGSERITLKTPHMNSMIRFGAPNSGHNMIISTDGPTLLHAGKDWDVKVGAKLNEEVTGDVHEKYLAAKNEMVPSGQVTEEYRGQHTTVHTVRSARYAQQETIVKGLNQQEYGSEIIECGPCKAHYANVGVVSDGPIVVTAPSVQINSPSVSIEGAEIKAKSGVWKGISGPSFQGYTTKNAAGIQSFEARALKLEMTECSLALVGTKFEHVSAKVDTFGEKITTATAAISTSIDRIENDVSRVANGAISACTFGLIKL